MLHTYLNFIVLLESPLQSFPRGKSEHNLQYVASLGLFFELGFALLDDSLLLLLLLFVQSRNLPFHLVLLLHLPVELILLLDDGVRVE